MSQPVSCADDRAPRDFRVPFTDSTSFRYTLWVVASRLRNRNVRLRESCEWPPSRPTREFIAVAAFGRQLRESDALRSPTPRQSSNLGIRFLVDAFARPQHLVATCQMDAPLSCGVSTSFRYTLWVVASRLRNRNVRLRESCEWPPSRPTREFIAVAAFGRQLRESDALRSPTPRQSSNLGIRFLVDAFARPQHLVAT